MTDKVASNLKQLKNINTEIKRLALKKKELNLQKKEIEDNIIEYLKENKQIGISCDNVVFLIKEVKKSKMKPKEEREKAALNLLNTNVQDRTTSSELLGKINELLKQKDVSFATKLKMSEPR